MIDSFGMDGIGLTGLADTIKISSSAASTDAYLIFANYSIKNYINSIINCPKYIKYLILLI